MRGVTILLAVFTFACGVARVDAATPVDAAMQSVARIIVVSPNSPEGEQVVTGSGFAISAGNLVTNEHVIRATRFDAEAIVYIVPSAGQPQRGQVLHFTDAGDLAIVRADRGGLTPMTVADVPVEKGRTVYSLGFPGLIDRIYSRDVDALITPTPPEQFQGTISSTGQSVHGVGPGATAIVHSALISGGNSGGPLVDECGRLIGVNTAVAGSYGIATSAADVVRFVRQSQKELATDQERCVSAAELEQIQRDAENAQTAAREAALQQELADFKAQSQRADNEIASLRQWLIGGLIVLTGLGLFAVARFRSRNLKTFVAKDFPFSDSPSLTGSHSDEESANERSLRYSAEKPEEVQQPALPKQSNGKRKRLTGIAGALAITASMVLGVWAISVVIIAFSTPQAPLVVALIEAAALALGAAVLFLAWSSKLKGWNWTWRDSLSWFCAAITLLVVPAEALHWQDVQGDKLVEPDGKVSAAAMNFYRPSAYAGQAASMYNIGRGLEDQDNPLALQWYNKAAKKRFPLAHYKISLINIDGTLGVKANVDQAIFHAVEYSRLASTSRAEQKPFSATSSGWGYGEVIGASEADLEPFAATNYVAHRLMEGEVVERDVNKAVELLRLGADGGSVNAQLYLGRVYILGTGVDEDVDTGIAWLTRASHSGSIEADLTLGKIYCSRKSRSEVERGLNHLKRVLSSDDSDRRQEARNATRACKGA